MGIFSRSSAMRVSRNAGLPRENDAAPSVWRLFGLWVSIGLQSFGGGASTTLLIQRTFIDRYQWLTMDEFSHLWGLCLLTPGINLIGVTLLIGRKLAGMRGMVASVAGLLVPSAAITCLLAAVFLRVEHAAVVQAVLRGVVPATAGIMALVAVNFARPLVRDSAILGRWYLWAAAGLVALFAGAIIVWNVSAIVIVLVSAVVGLLCFAPRSAPAPVLRPDEDEQD